MPNRTLICEPTPKRINPCPSLSISLDDINTDRTKWPDLAIGKLKGVVRVRTVYDNPDMLVVQVRMENALYKTAGRIHRVLQELLEEELDLDRTALRPNSGRAKLSQAVEAAHRNPATL